MATDSDDTDLKIVDFGLSKIIGPNESSLDPFGTLSYVAPEVLLQKPYGKEVDLWSLGVITYLLLSRVLPFDDEEDKEIARQTIQDAPDFSFDPWDTISDEAKDIVKSKYIVITDHKYRTSREEQSQTSLSRRDPPAPLVLQLQTNSRIPLRSGQRWHGQQVCGLHYSGP